MSLFRKSFYKLTSIFLLGALALTTVVSPTSATEIRNIEYKKIMNDALQEIDEFSNDNVQIEYIKEDEIYRETKIVSDNEEVITRLNKETNQFEIITQEDDVVTINLDDQEQSLKKRSLLAARPNERGSSLLYEAEYRGWWNYSQGKDFWALEWEGNTRNTFENNKNTSNIQSFVKAIDTLEVKERNLATALATGVPGVGVSVVIAAMAATPPAKLTAAVLAGIASTLALTAACLYIMNDMLEPVRTANRTFFKISIETPNFAPAFNESEEEVLSS